MRLVYLSPIPWSSFAQRPHKFVEWFHSKTDAKVLWVDPYPTRFPSLWDIFRIKNNKQSVDKSHPSWIEVLRPSALPIEPIPGSKLLNEIMWRSIFGKIREFEEEGNTFLCIGKPSVMALSLLKQFNQFVSIYDAMDDFPFFYSGLSRFALRRRERKVLRATTHVFTSATFLKQRLEKLRPDVQLVLNGLDPRTIPAPRYSQDSNNKKVFGYVGTVGSWFDWDWVIALANVRKSDIVRIMGPVYAAMPNKLPPNIEILPPCIHERALVAMKEFDVGLIPFKRNGLTASVDPIKYYEYRAVGLPVISTNFGEMIFRKEQEGTYLSFNLDDINAIVNEALTYMPNYESLEEYVNTNAWQARFTATHLI